MPSTVTGLSLSLDLVETNSQIERKIMKAIYEDFAKLIAKSSTSLTEQVRLVVRLTFYEQKEFDSLSGQGKLAKALGIADGATAAEWLVDRIVNGIKVNVTEQPVSGGTVSAKIEIISTIDPDQLVQEPQAIVTTKKGQELPWLDWLINEGRQEFIIGYKIYYAPIPQPRSRSGGAIMVEDEDSNWGVPDEFAGTPNDNLITRALYEAQQKIDGIVKAEMQKVFK